MAPQTARWQVKTISIKVFKWLKKRENEIHRNVSVSHTISKIWDFVNSSKICLPKC